MADAKDTKAITARLQRAIDALAAADENRGQTAEEVRAENKIRSRALTLLDHRARSRNELTTRLINTGFHPAAVTEVVSSLERAGLVDDKEFAHQWVHQRRIRRKKSKRALNEELKNKGVDAETRASALAEISEADEQETAKTVAKQRATTIRSLPGDRSEYDKYLRRIVGALARRGFSSSLSFRIAKAALDERLAALHD